jgi:hypothetical protein
MVHHRQRLPLGFESRHHLPRVHPQLDDLQRHAAAHGSLLLGHIDDAEPSFADFSSSRKRPMTVWAPSDKGTSPVGEPGNWSFGSCGGSEAPKNGCVAFEAGSSELGSSVSFIVEP